LPELIEVERYRQTADATVGHRIVSVGMVDQLMVIGLSVAMLVDAVTGRQVTATRRRGKLLMLDLDGGSMDADPEAGGGSAVDGHVLGLHFGMTGRLIVGDDDPIGILEYGPNTDDVKWDRFVADISDVGLLRLNDPRRLGRISLDPDESALGPEASTITVRQLTGALATSRTPLKARLLDQRRIAGLGNLLVDESLWRAGLAPGRPASSLKSDEERLLARTIRATVALLSRRGGSHTGDLQDHRRPGASCPRCGHPLRREQWGGRTTYWCPFDQN
jgi:formamidopyrimidine-DNA glycosylase